MEAASAEADRAVGESGDPEAFAMAEEVGPV